MDAQQHATRASQILVSQIGNLSLQLANEQARGDCLAMDVAQLQAENAELRKAAPAPTPAPPPEPPVPAAPPAPLPAEQPS